MNELIIAKFVIIKLASSYGGLAGSAQQIGITAELTLSSLGGPYLISRGYKVTSKKGRLSSAELACKNLRIFHLLTLDHL